MLKGDIGLKYQSKFAYLHEHKWAMATWTVTATWEEGRRGRSDMHQAGQNRMEDTWAVELESIRNGSVIKTVSPQRNRVCQ